MRRKKKDEHWAFDELRKRLNEKPQTIIHSHDDISDGKPRVLATHSTPDWLNGTIFMFDPELEQEITSSFYEFCTRLF
jgi:hypothetical protein